MIDYSFDWLSVTSVAPDFLTANHIRRMQRRLDWVIDLLIDWSIEWLIHLLIDWLIEWLFDLLMDLLNYWLIDWLILIPTYSLTYWLTDVLTVLLFEYKISNMQLYYWFENSKQQTWTGCLSSSRFAFPLFTGYSTHQKREGQRCLVSSFS